MESPILLYENSGSWLVLLSTRKVVYVQDCPSQKFLDRYILKGKDSFRLKNNIGVYKIGTNTGVLAENF